MTTVCSYTSSIIVYLPDLKKKDKNQYYDIFINKLSSDGSDLLTFLMSKGFKFSSKSSHVVSEIRFPEFFPNVSLQHLILLH